MQAAVEAGQNLAADEELARRLQEEELAQNNVNQARRLQVVQQTNEIADSIRGSARCVAIIIAFSIIEFIVGTVILQTTNVNSASSCQYLANIQTWLTVFVFRHGFTIPHEVYRCRAQADRDMAALKRSNEMDTLRLYVFIAAASLGLFLIMGKEATTDCAAAGNSLQLLKWFTFGLIMFHLVVTFSSLLMLTMLCLCLPCVLLILQYLQPNQGLDDVALEAIPERVFSDRDNHSDHASNPATCVICQVDFVNNDHLKHLRCNHEFHAECLDQWLTLKATCPLCRESVKGARNPEPVAENEPAETIADTSARSRLFMPNSSQCRLPFAAINPGLNFVIMSGTKRARQILRVIQKTPFDLYRLQSGLRVRPRERRQQEALDRASYDYELHDDGMIHPLIGSEHVGPNGLTLRPGGPVLGNLVKNLSLFSLFMIPAMTILPSSLVIVHEHSDYFSLQTSRPCTPEAFVFEVCCFLEDMPLISKTQYYRRHPPYYAV